MLTAIRRASFFRKHLHLQRFGFMVVGIDVRESLLIGAGHLVCTPRRGEAAGCDGKHLLSRVPFKPAAPQAAAEGTPPPLHLYTPDLKW